MLVKYIPGLMLREALSNRNIGFLVAAALGGLRMTDASPKVHSWLGGRVRAQGTWRPCSGMELGPSWEDNKDNTTRIWQRRKTEEDGAVEGSPTTPPGVCAWTQRRLRPESRGAQPPRRPRPRPPDSR